MLEIIKVKSKKFLIQLILFYLIRGLSGKSPAIVNITGTVDVMLTKPGSQGSRLECACMNSGAFTLLVSGGSERH